MSSGDLELLQEFAREGSQDAFAELVRRHLDLVYSAALRQVRSPELAQEITQSVFTDLARNASNLKPDTILTAWLYQVARRTAVDIIRRESRRQARERLAVEIAAMNASADWTQMESLLEEAMDSLEERDRAAILLRYFENRSLREVGQALGISDDAAQKRVSRAVERMRESFSSKGITVAATGIVVAISANAVHAAPVGLASTVATAAAAVVISASHTPVALLATKTIAMTTVQKITAAAALAAVVGTGLYQARQASLLRNQVQNLLQQQAPLQEQIRLLSGQRDEATNKLRTAQEEINQLQKEVAEVPKLRGDIMRLSRDSRELAQLKAGDASASNSSKALSWENRVIQLKERLQQTPSSQIPELQLLTDEDWLNAAKGDLKTDTDFRKALSALRGAAEGKLATMLQPALKAYMKANNDQFPTDIVQLQPYFASAVDPAVLQRWEIMPADRIKSLGMGGDMVISQKSPVDDVFDTCFGIGPNGYGSTDFLSKNTGDIVGPLYTAFSQAHNGDMPDDPSALLAYATTASQQEAIQKLILKKSATGK
jgi:RNA polymerase sigma factor (sigma-70 family)